MIAPPTPARSGRRLGAGPGRHARSATWLSGQANDRPSPPARSGRRFGAGPGHHSLSATWLSGQATVPLLVISAALALMAAPGIVAALSLILGGRLAVPSAPWAMPFDVALVIESGRALLFLALATRVFATTEPE